VQGKMSGKNNKSQKAGSSSTRTEEQVTLKKIPFSRDIKIMTEVLILLELINNPRLKLKEIAAKLDISKQAVSDYLQKSIDGKRLEKTSNGYKVTYKGVDMLQTTLVETRDFVDGAIKQLSVFNQVTAIAKNSIKENDEVGLFMEDGFLVAYARRESRSTGISLHDAELAEEVRVGSLKGVVDHEIATLTMVKLPDRSRNCNMEKLAVFLDEHVNNKLAALDLVSIAVIKKIEKKTDIKFVPVEASLEAVMKGVPVIVMGTAESLKRMEEAISKHNSSYHGEIPLTAIDFAKQGDK